MALIVNAPGLNDLLRSIHNLPTIPETLLRVLTLIDQEDSQAAELATVICVDPPLTARILRLANSPYYDGGGNITDILDCITLLGYTTVREVSLCVMLADTLLQACRDEEVRIDYRPLWRHSVYTAVLAQKLALQLGDPAPGEIFTAGLLHDLGKFVEVLHRPLDFAEVVKEQQKTGHDLLKIETSIFGFHHAQIGAAFAEKWYFPTAVADVIKFHHDIDAAARMKSRVGKAVLIVALADSLAHDCFSAGEDFCQNTGKSKSVVFAGHLGLSEDFCSEMLDMMPELTDRVSWLAG